MKLLFLVGFMVLLAAGAFCEIRVARIQYYEKCDKRYSPADCSTYANTKSKTLQFCHSFLVNKAARAIYWERCGKIHCLADNLQLVDEDLSKPYPECCEHCETIDPAQLVV